jgi:membrane protease YdiL (CAAX protease family)
MLQRIQTIYLIAAAVVTGVLPFVFPLWKQQIGATISDFYFMVDLSYVALFGLSTTLSIVSIMGFKKRQNQFVMGRLNIILNLFLLGLFVYRLLTVSGETSVSEKGIGMFLPIVAIVFLVLANKAIKKDEDLVKSVDRLR